jgi:hypothetical protein
MFSGQLWAERQLLTTCNAFVVLEQGRRGINNRPPSAIDFATTMLGLDGDPGHLVKPPLSPEGRSPIARELDSHP